MKMLTANISVKIPTAIFAVMDAAVWTVMGSKKIQVHLIDPTGTQP